MVSSTGSWLALPKLQVLQLRLSSSLLWMQGGLKARRSCAIGRDGPEAYPFHDIQTMGKYRAPTQLREGSGDTGLASSGRSTEEETSSPRVQGVATSRPARQAKSAGQETHLYLRQATGVACRTAEQGPAAPQGVSHDPPRVGKASGRSVARSQKDPDGAFGAFLGGIDEVCPSPTQRRRYDRVLTSGGVCGQPRALQGPGQSSARLGPPSHPEMCRKTETK
eukprot:6033611-Amphidinium_carterae.1